jgi:hypothetical protein
MPVITIPLTAALAFIAWLVQRAFSRTDEQRRAASKLSAYLTFWQTRILAMDLFGVLYIGGQWYDEWEKIVRARGSDAAAKLVALDNKYQKEIAEELRSKLSAEAGAPSKELAELKNALAKFTTARAETIGHLQQLRKELVEGRTFVSDPDVAVLDAGTVQRAVELRLTLVGLLERAIFIFQSIEVQEEDQVIQTIRNEAITAITAAFRAGFAIKYLSVRCNSYLQRHWWKSLRANLL